LISASSETIIISVTATQPNILATHAPRQRSRQHAGFITLLDSLGFVHHACRIGLTNRASEWVVLPQTMRPAQGVIRWNAAASSLVSSKTRQLSAWHW